MMKMKYHCQHKSSVQQTGTQGNLVMQGVDPKSRRNQILGTNESQLAASSTTFQTTSQQLEEVWGNLQNRITKF